MDVHEREPKRDRTQRATRRGNTLTNGGTKRSREAKGEREKKKKERRAACNEMHVC